MPLTANDPSRKSWLNVPKDSDFPIQNIPFGVFITKDDVVTIGTRIGDYAIDLGALQHLNYCCMGWPRLFQCESLFIFKGRIFK